MLSKTSAIAIVTAHYDLNDKVKAKKNKKPYGKRECKGSEPVARDQQDARKKF